MKRFHVHVDVNDLSKCIAFYSAMFGEQPAVVKTDYAKWMLEDPRVNFAISNRGQEPGVNHLGLQAEDDAPSSRPFTRTFGMPTPQCSRKKVPTAVTPSPTSIG
jgi:hypothetical protein